LAKGKNKGNNNTNKKQKFPENDRPIKNASRARITAEDLKNLRRSPQQPFEPPSPTPPQQQPKQKAKEQGK
jgi:hypothetical protein